MAERHEWRCDICGATAGVIEVADAGEVQRTTFTGLMILPQSLAGVREAVRAGDIVALHGLKLELAAWWCPDCRACYCGAHWQWWDEFDEGFHDEIRGICPAGHERMLED